MRYFLQILIPEFITIDFYIEEDRGEQVVPVVVDFDTLGKAPLVIHFELDGIPNCVAEQRAAL